MKVTNFNKILIFLLLFHFNSIFSTTNGLPVINVEIDSIKSTNAIFINSSSEFRSLAQQESWMGNGTQINPYIIANKYINVSGERIISINNTDLYFQIRNCTLVGTGIFFRNVTNGVLFNNSIIDEPKQSGIYMENCANIVLTSNRFSHVTLIYTNNGIIGNNTINDVYGGNRVTLDMCSNLVIESNAINKFNPGNQLEDEWDLADNINYTEGITVKGSYNITLSKNIITNCDNGITVKQSEMIEITNNSIQGIDDKGILLTQTRQSTIKNNTVEYSFFGIAIESDSHENDIMNNLLRYISGDGIYLYSSQENYIFQNEIYCEQPYYVAEGIFLHYAQDNIVVENEIHQCWIGIMLDYSTANVLSNNIITDSDAEGIWIHLSSDGNEIRENKIYRNRNGILLEECMNNIVTKNEISENYMGIYLKEADRNSISNNNISYNHGNSVYLESSDWNTVSYNTIYGNGIDKIVQNNSEGNTITQVDYTSPGWSYPLFFTQFLVVVLLRKKEFKPF